MAEKDSCFLYNNNNENRCQETRDNDLSKQTSRVHITDMTSGKTDTFFRKYKTDEINGNSGTHHGAVLHERRRSLYEVCYWILFWTAISVIACNIMASDNFAEAFPAMSFLGEILSIICVVMYGIILLILSHLDPVYLRAGTFVIAESVLNILAFILSVKTNNDLCSLICALSVFAAFIIAIIAACNEFLAHSRILSGIDNKMSGKWVNFRIWFIVLSVLVPFGSIALMAVFAIIFSFLSFILIGYLLCAVSILIVSILRICYLYSTARAYRMHADALAEAEAKK